MNTAHLAEKLAADHDLPKSKTSSCSELRSPPSLMQSHAGKKFRI